MNETDHYLHSSTQFQRELSRVLAFFSIKEGRQEGEDEDGGESKTEIQDQVV